MNKKYVQNYLKAIKYIFTTLGTMFLGMMIGVSILIPGLKTVFASLANGVTYLVNNVNLDAQVLFKDVWNSILSLDWNNPFRAIKTLFSSTWLNENILQILNNLLGTDVDIFTAEIETLVNNFVIGVIVCIVAFVLCWIIGFIVGYFITEFQIRRDFERKSNWKLILEILLNAFLTVLFIVLALFLLSLWKWSVIFSVILLISFASCFSLFEANLLRGKNKIPFKTIFKFKNISKYGLNILIIYGITIVITIISLLINYMLGLFIGLSLIQITHIVIHLNAEMYIDTIETNLK